MDDIDKRMKAMEILESMTPEDRLDIINRFCQGCGRKEHDYHFCQCENDE